METSDIVELGDALVETQGNPPGNSPDQGLPFQD